MFRRSVVFYRLDCGDMGLVRAQFRDLFRQIPLLYSILVGNVVAVTVAAWHIDAPILGRAVPVLLCTVCATRAVWWWRRKFSDFSDAEIVRHMRNMCWLTGILAATVVGWILALYPYGNSTDHANFIFFLSITQICCVFCLMPVRSAALSVASIGIGPIVAYFLYADDGRMAMQAMNLALVGLGMVVVLTRYNRTFADLIHSQRDLRLRQIDAERLSEENRRIALTDALSGLPNRRALIDRLEDIHGRSVQGPVSVAILFVDLDGFKQINDNFGHELGDAIIRHISREFSALIPPGAVLYRMGGDEFSILLESAQAEFEAMVVADKIQAWLSLPFGMSGHEFHVGASIGLASCHDEEVDPYELLRRADTAMYRAKADGGCGTMVYAPEMDAGRAWRQTLEVQIRHGLERGEFDVVYQPLVDSSSGVILAVEALARWPRRPDGPLGPDEFIPIAETSGLIHPLGMQVLRRSCRELAAHPDITLNVNISPAQFRHPRFEQDVADVLREAGFPPERLQIEITEGYLIDNPDRANRVIASFARMGVRVALDDFGSGFASIGYLRNFAFSRIKIDKSLARGLGEDPKASLLISGMVHLANGLDMFVTAEGVETERQASLFRLAGCHELQGFLFGQPAPLSEIFPERAAA